MQPTSDDTARTVGATQARQPQQSWLWKPTLIVFISSACIMVLELVAGRIIAPHVGVSLYTWTSVIGVVLAGISLGNYVGGRLADRWASPRLLGIIFLLGGLTSLAILAVDEFDVTAQIEWPLIAEILVLIAALFFLPSTILGTISPIVAKLAVRDLAKTGSTVGRIYAAGSVGSIVGTFLTGFLLISWFGTHAIVWGVGLLLLLLGLLFLLRSRWLWALPAVLLLAGAALPMVGSQWLNGPCTRETNYFCIKVQEEEREGETVRVLVLDRLVHSYSSLKDPTRLVYGYEKVYGELTAYQAQRKESALRALFIGGGGYTFPRYMEAVYPDSELHVIEIDPGVTEIAYEMLGLDRDTRVVSYSEDARMFLARDPRAIGMAIPPGVPQTGPGRGEGAASFSPPASGGDVRPLPSAGGGAYDLILGDAFNDFSVPYHLTTVEFNDRVHAWLAEDGLYMVNIIDGAYGRFLRAYTRTLRQSFRHVYLAPTIDSWREATRSTFVIVASDAPLDMTVLYRANGGNPLFARQLLDEAEVDALLGEARLVMLTDRYAPVDQMLAPVFQDRVAR
jgi:spermidine synthase